MLGLGLEQSVVWLQRVLFSILKAHVLKFDSWNAMLWTTLTYAIPVFIVSTIILSYTLGKQKDDPNVEDQLMSIIPPGLRPLAMGATLTIGFLVVIYWYREHLMFKEILETSPYRMFDSLGILVLLLMAMSVLQGRLGVLFILFFVLFLFFSSDENEYNLRQKDVGVLLSRLAQRCPDMKKPCDVSGQIDGKFIQFLDSSTPEFLQTMIQMGGGWSAIMKSLVKLEEYQNTLGWITNPFKRLGDSVARSIGIAPTLKSAVK
jgi:hypothetical protein